MRRRIAQTVVFVAFCAGCSELRKPIEEYSGDGTIERTVRRYQPGVESEGYRLELPSFSLSESVKKTYSLHGLPVSKQPAHFELITYIPKERAAVLDLEKIAPVIPPTHKIKAVLLNQKTGKIVALTAKAVADLDDTHAMSLFRARFIKNLFDVDLANLASTSDLVLAVEYDTGNEPVASEAVIVVVVEAPTL